ncbi:hypothetical protein [Streptomyces sp. L2]|uniref:hypothetical protein n=1 Tax=Streptomyces sp. L2 TaxID=2162665 RepID=UPI0010105F87|nr:hypothetical protein [Streptomyces sp. L2]
MRDPGIYSPQFADFDQAVYSHPILTGIDETARYGMEYSTDGGRTWQPDPQASTVCGGHVQSEIAYALRAAGDSSGDGVISLDGSTVTVRRGNEWTRWIPPRGERA